MLLCFAEAAAVPAESAEAQADGADTLIPVHMTGRLRATCRRRQTSVIRKRGNGILRYGGGAQDGRSRQA